MTPAQRQYDLDLAKAMLAMAYWIEPRSRKVSDTLKRGAERIMTLSAIRTEVDLIAPKLHPEKPQPASTPTKHR